MVSLKPFVHSTLCADNYLVLNFSFHRDLFQVSILTYWVQHLLLQPARKKIFRYFATHSKRLNSSPPFFHACNS